MIIPGKLGVDALHVTGTITGSSCSDGPNTIVIITGKLGDDALHVMGISIGRLSTDAVLKN